jgi:hypothetical protein
MEWFASLIIISLVIGLFFRGIVSIILGIIVTILIGPIGGILVGVIVYLALKYGGAKLNSESEYDR